MGPLAFPLHTGKPMTELVARSGAWLVQQAAALPDTIVTKMVAAERGWFETVTGIASGILSITLVVLTIFVAPAAWQFWKTFKKAQALFDRFESEVGPLSMNAKALATRLGELNALLEVAQEEAEGAFVSTASAVRGLRRGAATLTDDGREDFDEDLEEDYGDDDESDEDAHEREQRLPRNQERSGRPARPRLRSYRPDGEPG